MFRKLMASLLRCLPFFPSPLKAKQTIHYCTCSQCLSGSAENQNYCSMLTLYYLLPCMAWAFTAKEPLQKVVHQHPTTNSASISPGTMLFSALNPSLDTGSSGPTGTKSSSPSDAFLTDYYVSCCDNTNMPPSLIKILSSFNDLASGSDVRGRFVDHPRLGSPTVVSRAIARDAAASNLPALTPFATHCLGYAFATMLKNELKRDNIGMRLATSYLTLPYETWS